MKKIRTKNKASGEELDVESSSPTFECVLDSDDDSVHMPPSQSPIWRVHPKDIEAPRRPKTWMIERVDSIEVQVLSDHEKKVKRDNRKRYSVIAACILVASIILASVLGVKLSQRGGDSKSLSSAVGPGAEEEPTLAEEELTADEEEPTAGEEESTAAPTPAPLVCEKDSLTASKQCYLVGEEIKLKFVNCDPREDDWLGIYSPQANPDLMNYVDWLWTCGNQNCVGEVMGDTLLFVGLDVGTYEAHLSRNNRNNPYISLAGTPFDFTVADTC